MRFFTLFIGILFTLPTLANWQLVNEKSQFNFITTKNNNVTEVHKFTQLKGAVSPKGQVSLTLDLSSVETNIPIRNERMQKFLFNTGLFPKATFTAMLNQSDIDSLNVGDLKQIDLAGEINLHGIKQAVNTRVQVIKLKDNALQVSSLQPIIIQAGTFDLTAGVEKLQALAHLSSINSAVPVTFSLTFVK